MRRRPKEDLDSPVPVRLRRYDATDWPSPECHPECAYWAAVGAWREAHPDEDDDTLLAAVPGPDTPWHEEWI